MFSKTIHTRQPKTLKTVGMFTFAQEDVLGKGNQAIVYKGKNSEKSKNPLNIDNEVAIKVIDGETLGKGINKKLLDSEIKVLKALKGKPYILSLY